ncbi:hypothetical protein ACB098_12G060500 [Castanea mollissima]
MEASFRPISFPFLAFLFLPNFFFFFCTGLSELRCIDTERQALLNFKQHLIDPSNRLSSWTAHGDCCQWEGIVCHNLTAHVHQLNLTSYYVLSVLGGKLNPSLLDLKHLNYFDLSYNNFNSTPIPSFLGLMKSLTHLNLSNAGFVGLIPHQLGNLSNLHFLNLEGYDLYVNNIQWLSGIPLLQHLDMSYVNLSKPSDWVQLTNALPSLLDLRLSHCQLRSIPLTSSVNFSSLLTLDLSENYFENTLIPSWIFGLRNLVSLDLSYNHFQGPISVDLQNMTSLSHLDLSENNFNSSIPNWLYSFSRLEFLNLRNSNLQGTISSAIGNLTSVISIDLSGNELGGKLPRSLGNLCNLREITLSSNKWSQEISEILESLSGCLSDRLEILDLSSSQLHGQLTDELGVFKNLVELSFERNSISGKIPDCWMKWNSLVVLNLANNNFSGSFPASIGSLRLLKSLHLYNNKFSGNLPSSLKNCENLVTFDVAENEFAGSIPSWIGHRFSSLMILNLHSNNFHGHIPKELCALTSLQILDLSHNKLSGGILGCVKNFSAMATKNNSNPDMSFHLPDYYYGAADPLESELLVIKGQVLEYSTILHLVKCIDFSKNSLSGEIPKEITNLQGLQSLNLSYNLLIGSIPENIGAMGSLESIDFSMNQLFGQIPSSMSSLTFLNHLNLSNNNLIGKIPLGTQLQSFNESSFTGNKLCGLPLSNNCAINDVNPNNENKGSKHKGGLEVDWFFVSMALGFVVGFWGNDTHCGLLNLDCNRFTGNCTKLDGQNDTTPKIWQLASLLVLVVHASEGSSSSCFPRGHKYQFKILVGLITS